MELVTFQIINYPIIPVLIIPRTFSEEEIFAVDKDFVVIEMEEDFLYLIKVEVEVFHLV